VTYDTQLGLEPCSMAVPAFDLVMSQPIFARKGLRNKNLFEASMLVMTACCLAFPLPSL
jgi:hypothetical protein